MPRASNDFENLVEAGSKYGIMGKGYVWFSATELVETAQVLSPTSRFRYIIAMLTQMVWVPGLRRRERRPGSSDGARCEVLSAAAHSMRCVTLKCSATNGCHAACVLTWNRRLARAVIGFFTAHADVLYGQSVLSACSHAPAHTRAAPDPDRGGVSGGKGARFQEVLVNEPIAHMNNSIFGDWGLQQASLTRSSPTLARDVTCLF